MARPTTHPLTLDEAQALAATFLERRRALHGDARMDAGDGDAGAGDGGAGKDGADGGKTFTQADLDRIAGETRASVRAQFADYDDLKAKAGAAKTTEQKLADLERELNNERLARVRLDVASKTPGLGAEWADDLKGANKDELEAHAKSLSERLTKLAGGAGGRGRQTGSSSRPGGANRTVREGAGTALTPKQQAVQALRGLRGGTSSADD